MINVLVTATGTGVGQSIIKSLKLFGNKYRIIGTDINKWASGLYRCDVSYIIPNSNDVNYIKKIINIIEKEDIDVVFPGCDPELIILAQNRNKIEDEYKSKIIVSKYELIEVLRDKYLTYKFLKKQKFPFVETYLLEKVKENPDIVNYPCIIKPRYGSGSQGIKVIFNKKELYNNLDPFLIVQNYIIPLEWKNQNITKNLIYKNGLLNQQHEYSTELIVSKNKYIMGVITNWRTMKKGYPIRAIIDNYDEINLIMKKIAPYLLENGLLGPCNFQCRISVNGPIFFEINPRFSGSTAVRSAAGFNGPDAIIRDVILNEKDIIMNYKKLVEIRFWNELYLDFDKFSRINNDNPIKLKGDIKNYF